MVTSGRLTVAEAELELLPGVGSVVVLLAIVAVFVTLRLAMFKLFGSVCTTRVNVWLAEAAKVAHVQDTVPVAPTNGVVQVKPEPLLGVSDANVVPAGSESESVTF